MPLLKCRECGSEISSDCTECIRCGCKTPFECSVCGTDLGSNKKTNSNNKVCCYHGINPDRPLHCRVCGGSLCTNNFMCHHCGERKPLICDFCGGETDLYWGNKEKHAHYIETGEIICSKIICHTCNKVMCGNSREHETKITGWRSREFDDDISHWSIKKQFCKICAESFVSPEHPETLEARRRAETQKPAKDKGHCYIATACYGDYNHPDVIEFRRFRDEHLCSTRLGRQFITTYYAVSPRLANSIGKSQWLSAAIRSLILSPLAQRLRERQ